jgi:hypothetical protein
MYCDAISLQLLAVGLLRCLGINLSRRQSLVVRCVVVLLVARVCTN